MLPDKQVLPLRRDTTKVRQSGVTSRWKSSLAFCAQAASLLAASLLVGAASAQSSAPPNAPAPDAPTPNAPAPNAPQQTADDPLTPAKKLFDEQKFPAAEAATRAYLQYHVISADAHYLLGLILFREDKAKESLAEYTEAARYRPPTAADLKVVSLDYVLIDDYEDAERWLLKSTAWDPMDAAAWYSLGRVQYKLNHFLDALKSFEQSLALDPRSVKAENNLGLTLEALNRPDEAIAAYRQAIAWQQDAAHPSEQPMLNLGTILIGRNQVVEATQLLERAVAIAPNDPKIHEELGRAYLQQNNLDAAARHLEHAIALSPDDARLHFQLGQVYQKQRLIEKAKAEFARTEALNGSRSTPQ